MRIATSSKPAWTTEKNVDSIQTKPATTNAKPKTSPRCTCGTETQDYREAPWV